MGTLTRHLTAMQATATVMLTIAGAIGAPLFAEQSPDVTGHTDAYYADTIVSLFLKTGAHTAGIFDDRTIDTSSFDFAGYMSHTCFKPTEYDRVRCATEFGPYADLKNTYDSGKLFLMLRERPLVAGAAQFAPAPVGVVAPQALPEQAVPVINAEPPSPEQLVRERSIKLWKVCHNKKITRAEVADCYQRNIRRTQEWNADVNEENVF